MNSLENSQSIDVSSAQEIPLEEDNWQFDEFNDGVMKSVRTIQKEQLQKCINDYVKQLNGLALSLDEAADNYWSPVTSNNSEIVGTEFDLDENTSMVQIIQNASPNEELNKMLLVFGVLCSEIKFLKKMANEKFYPILLFYGEDQGTEKRDENDCESHEKITAFLPQIIELSKFIYQCQAVYRNLMCQLAAVHSKKHKSMLSGVNMSSIMDHLALLLGILLRLDEIILFNQVRFTVFSLTLNTIKRVFFVQLNRYFLLHTSV